MIGQRLGFGQLECPEARRLSKSAGLGNAGHGRCAHPLQTACVEQNIWGGLKDKYCRFPNGCKKYFQTA